MSRAIILLMDSFGIGSSLDADRFNDVGANTYAHIAEHCAKGKADVPGLRSGPLKIPNLIKLGLNMATLASSAYVIPNWDRSEKPEGLYGYAVEQSRGKDTPSGHWEIAGVPITFDWGYFPETIPCFPEALIHDLITQAKLPGVLGNKHASGTEILSELGQTHIETGKPIVYTSADSVFQIAAHETYFGLKRLYEICETARKLVDDYQIGRVIARPFLGEPPKFYRTSNRKDYSTPPPAPTLLDDLIEHKAQVYAIGKIGDIFAHQGISHEIKVSGNKNLFDKTLEVLKTAPSRSLIFTNFVDFDQDYGHRRNVAGYAAALEDFDKRLPEFKALLKEDDLAIITADHGCDPTWRGTDHTREHIPFLAFGPKIPSRFIGRRDTFADIGQTIAYHLGIPPLKYGNPSFS